MRRLRTRKSLVLFGIGVAIFSGVLPAFGISFAAVLATSCLVEPIVVVLLDGASHGVDVRPLGYLSILLSRAPPIFTHA